MIRSTGGELASCWARLGSTGISQVARQQWPQPEQLKRSDSSSKSFISFGLDREPSLPTRWPLT